MNAEKPVVSTSRNTNWDFDVYDAYYNGTFTLGLQPDANNSDLAQCLSLNSYTISDAYFRIGPQTRNGLSRASYDSNPFYFAFGQTQNSIQCPQIHNNLYASLESSNDLLVYGRPWVVQAVKKGSDTFQLTGSVTSPRASYNNYYNYLVNTTDTEYQNTTDGCPVYFSKKTITSVNQLTMSATVDATGATVTWSFFDPDVGYNITGFFMGNWWMKGAKLDFSSSKIETIGQSKRVVTIPKTAIQKNLKWIILGSIVAAIIALLLCICCCCSHLFGRPRRWSSLVQQLFERGKMKSRN